MSLCSVFSRQRLVSQPELFSLLCIVVVVTDTPIRSRRKQLIHAIPRALHDLGISKIVQMDSDKTTRNVNVARQFVSTMKIVR